MWKGRALTKKVIAFSPRHLHHLYLCITIRLCALTDFYAPLCDGLPTHQNERLVCLPRLGVRAGSGYDPLLRYHGAAVGSWTDGFDSRNLQRGQCPFFFKTKFLIMLESALMFVCFFGCEWNKTFFVAAFVRSLSSCWRSGVEEEKNRGRNGNHDWAEHNCSICRNIRYCRNISTNSISDSTYLLELELRGIWNFSFVTNQLVKLTTCMSWIWVTNNILI